MLIDTHCHLDDERFDGDRDEVIARMRGAGVGMCVTIGADVRTSKKAIEIAEKYDFIYAACGVHPHEAKDMTDSDMQWLKSVMPHPKVRAWGEIGLDYYYNHSEKGVQRECFERQLSAAAEIGKPVVLHIRDAHGEAYETLSAYKGLPKCLLHCYTGSAQMLERYLALGLYVSFSGSVTFKNAVNLREAAKIVPGNRLMVETDCPYLAPEPVRGKRNECAYTAHTAKFLAQLRGTPEDEFADITTANAKEFFGIA